MVLAVAPWVRVLLVIVSTIGVYVFVITLLRGAGKRTLSSLNAFDFVVTVTLGSTVSSVALSGSRPTGR